MAAEATLYSPMPADPLLEKSERDRRTSMATETVQLKVSGMMCSFCTMTLEKALKRYPGVNSVLVNLVHGVVLVEADMAKISREELAARSSIDTEVSL